MQGKTTGATPLTQGDRKMDSHEYTVQELAGSETLWNEYIDPGDNAQFDDYTQEEREAMILEIWPETPTGE